MGGGRRPGRGAVRSSIRRPRRRRRHQTGPGPRGRQHGAGVGTRRPPRPAHGRPSGRRAGHDRRRRARGTCRRSSGGRRCAGSARRRRPARHPAPRPGRDCARPVRPRPHRHIGRARGGGPSPLGGEPRATHRGRGPSSDRPGRRDRRTDPRPTTRGRSSTVGTTNCWRRSLGPDGRGRGRPCESPEDGSPRSVVWSAEPGPGSRRETTRFRCPRRAGAPSARTIRRPRKVPSRFVRCRYPCLTVAGFSLPSSTSSRVSAVPARGREHGEHLHHQSVRDSEATGRHRRGPDRDRFGRPRGAETPEAGADGQLPRPDGRRLAPRLHRVPCPVQHGAGPVQGRYPLPPSGDAGRGPRARGLDDVEVRGRQHPLWGSEGRRGLRPEAHVPERARRAHPHGTRARSP